MLSEPAFHPPGCGFDFSTLLECRRKFLKEFQSKAMSVTNELAGGALVPSPAFSLKKRRKVSYLGNKAIIPPQVKKDCRWVTIPANGRGDGGSPVCIGDDGKIRKGPAKLQGKKPNELKPKKPKEPEKKPESEKPEKEKPREVVQIEKPSSVKTNFADKLPPVLDTIDNHGLSLTEMPSKDRKVIERAANTFVDVLDPHFAAILDRTKFAAVKFSKDGEISPDAAGIYLPGHGKGKDEPTSAFIGIEPGGKLHEVEGKPGKIYADPSPEGKVRHELGHAIFSILQGDEREWEFRQALFKVTLYGGGKWRPSLYAEENFKECYAEFFAMVTRPGFDKSKLPPEVQKVVDMVTRSDAENKPKPKVKHPKVKPSPFVNRKPLT